MDKRNTIIIVLLLIIAAGVFVVSFFSRSRIDTPDSNTSQENNNMTWDKEPAGGIKDLVVTPKTVVTAKHAYRNSTHIIAGEIPLPTPCHLLESTSVVSPDKQSVTLTLTSSIKTGESCAEMITPARFKVTAIAERTARIVATLNGQEIVLNLIEAGPNENLDDFELYIKG